ESCSCGSGKKAKRCCGVRRGPSEADLARAWLDVEARQHARRLVRLDEQELHDVFEEMCDLPQEAMALQLPLPRVLPPELEELRAAIDEDDEVELVHALPAALARVDRPQTRKALAEAVLDRRDAGAVDPMVASAAVVDLADARRSELLREALIEALA